MKKLLIFLILFVVGCGPSVLVGAGAVTGYLLKNEKTKRYYFVNEAAPQPDDEETLPAIEDFIPVGSRVLIFLKKGRPVDGIVDSYGVDFLFVEKRDKLTQVFFDEIKKIKVYRAESNTDSEDDDDDDDD